MSRVQNPCQGVNLNLPIIAKNNNLEKNSFLNCWTWCSWWFLFNRFVSTRLWAKSWKIIWNPSPNLFYSAISMWFWVKKSHALTLTCCSIGIALHLQQGKKWSHHFFIICNTILSSCIEHPRLGIFWVIGWYILHFFYVFCRLSIFMINYAISWLFAM